MEAANEIKDLLIQRDELCKEMLAVTEGVVFTQDVEIIEDETRQFADLYGKRESLFEKLRAINAEIGEERLADLRRMSEGEGGEELILLLRSDASIKRIIELDKLNMEVGQLMVGNIRDGIKRIKQGRNLSLKYSGELVDTDGFLLDNKN
jgi:hypothetical protein